MIDHIKLAEKHFDKTIDNRGRVYFESDEYGLQAYTNAILEHAAVKCEEENNRTLKLFGVLGAAVSAATKIRQEKV